MSEIDVLRRAASLMLQRAQVAEPFKEWEALLLNLDEHTISWGPDVALVVADWLYSYAEENERLGVFDQKIVAIARTYLGEQA